MSRTIRSKGGCHCGAIRYEAEIDPDQIIICHCTDCQTLSGSAYRTVAFVPEQKFHLIQGEPKVYVKIAESGNEREQTFCAACGSPIYSAPHTAPGDRLLGIRAGTLEIRNQLIPKKQFYKHSSALDWVEDLTGIEVAGEYKA